MKFLALTAVVGLVTGTEVTLHEVDDNFGNWDWKDFPKGGPADPMPIHYSSDGSPIVWDEALNTLKTPVTVEYSGNNNPIHREFGKPEDWIQPEVPLPAEVANFVPAEKLPNYEQIRTRMFEILDQVQPYHEAWARINNPRVLENLDAEAQ